jgi:hypothetical protein
MQVGIFSAGQAGISYSRVLNATETFDTRFISLEPKYLRLV